MTIASIMVYVDFDDATEARVRLAAEIAAEFNAALIGISGWPLRKDEASRLVTIEHPPAPDGRLEAILQLLEALGQRFRKIAGANPHGVEWRSSTDFPREFAATAARAADLLVIGREFSPDDVYRTYDPGTIILAAGRPVLTVPPGLHRLQMSRVLVAWKGTREARRAVHDALPFLQRAKVVDIAAVSLPGAAGAAAEIADVAQYLGRHNVAVSRQIATAVSEDEGAGLLDLAKQQQADLIVAGAYGRTRLSEWIFGGVTRQLLTTSPIPCLFSN
ncbi:MAG TPA: universal stress protein [Xanthobacteraceae bacterium]|nr:universal stress protein [Xanthobacteraceae bacterium]